MATQLNQDQSQNSEELPSQNVQILENVSANNLGVLIILSKGGLIRLSKDVPKNKSISLLIKVLKSRWALTRVTIIWLTLAQMARKEKMSRQASSNGQHE